MNIPDEAVEAAAEFMKGAFDGREQYGTDWEYLAEEMLPMVAPFIAAQALRNVADDEPNWLWNIICGETCVKGIERVDHDAIADQVRDAIRTRAAELETK